MLTQEVIEYISQKQHEHVQIVSLSLGDLEVRVASEGLKQVLAFLRDDPALRFTLLLSVTAVDYLDAAAERFEVVYHLRSLHLAASRQAALIRVKVSVSENNPTISSIVSLWPGANFMERECWDMYGVVFEGHPNLTRILMYDEFKGHPLRKDYPVQLKQPRVQLRYPEVENTARYMHRPSLGGDLVQISPRKG
jgi:NADH-quinone oxidoreductase subunit C